MPYDQVIRVLGPPDDVWTLARLRTERAGAYQGADACVWYKMGRQVWEDPGDFNVVEICFSQDRKLAFWAGLGLRDTDPMADFRDTRTDQDPWSN